MANLILMAGGTSVASGKTSPFSWASSMETAGVSSITMAATTDSSAFSVNVASATYGLQISLGAGPDTVTGTAYADTINTFGGNDSITGGAGNDIIDGGAGDDAFVFGANFGVDTVATASAANGEADVYKFTSYSYSDLTFQQTGANLSLVTAAGDAVEITGFATAASTATGTKFITTDKTFHVFASTGSTTINGTTGADYIFVTGSSVTMDGKGGADTLVGAAGDDTFVYGSSVVSYKGGAGNDTVQISGTTAATIDLTDTKYTSIEIAAGGSGNDVLKGLSDASDTLNGGAGNDNMWSRSGTDVLTGSTGNDTFSFAYGDGSDTITDVTGTAVTDADTVRFVGVNYSALSFSNSGADIVAKYGDDQVTLTNYTTATEKNITWVTSDKTFHVFASTGAAIAGTTGADYIYVASGSTAIDGKGGADTLVGGAGDDVFTYKAGFASIAGGAGTDEVTATGQTAAVTLDLFNSALYTSVEKATGGDGNDLIRSSTAGGETLEGGAGRDNLWSNAGDDVMGGGTGVDTYWFQAGDGTDTVNAVATTADADVFNFKNVKFSDMSFAYTGGALDITYGGDVAHLSSFTYAAQGVNTFQTTDATFHIFLDTDGTTTTFSGTTGADYIKANGSGVNYTINGGAGADTIIGGDGNDTISFKTTFASVDGGTGSNTLTAASATVGMDLNLAASNIANVTNAIGSSYNDVLRGTSSDDSIVGGAGSDHLWGRAGNDTLTGGTGADTYWFGTGDGTDRITDDATNSLDTVKLYNAAVTSQSLSSGDLVLNLADGSNLTIAGWESTSSKLNKFEYNGTVYRLSNDATTWSKA